MLMKKPAIGVEPTTR